MTARARRAAELAAYIAEAGITAAFARYLHLQDRQYEPDWTWAAVMAGVIISSAPAIVLARLAPADWRRYEGRVAAGFLVSGGIIIPWQVWLAAYSWGQQQGYRWASSDQETTVERKLRSAA